MLSCTGLGVLRRHPEGKWHKKPDEGQEIVKTQKEMIRHALEAVEGWW